AVGGELAPAGGGGVDRKTAQRPDAVEEELVARRAFGDAALFDAADAVEDHAVLLRNGFQRRRVGRDALDRRAVAVVAGGEAQVAGIQRPVVAADDVDAAGLRIERIGEVAPALHAEDAVLGGQIVADRAGQVLGQVDAVVDVDLVGVDGDV